MPNTAKAYRAALARFAAWLDGRPVSDATFAAAAVGIDGASGHSCRVGIVQSFIERGAVKTYFGGSR